MAPNAYDNNNNIGLVSTPLTASPHSCEPTVFKFQCEFTKTARSLLNIPVTGTIIS